MACCLTAPSHYLNKGWLIISKVLWHSSADIIMRRFEDTISKARYLKSHYVFPGAIELTLLKYGTSCPVRSTASTMLSGSSQYLAYMLRVLTFNLDLYVQGHSDMTLQYNNGTEIGHIVLCPFFKTNISQKCLRAWESVSRGMTFDFNPYLQVPLAMTLQCKLRKYCTYWHIRSVVSAVLNGFFTYIDLAGYIQKLGVRENSTFVLFESECWSQYFGNRYGSLLCFDVYARSYIYIYI